jgi:hypothetical protein
MPDVPDDYWLRRAGVFYDDDYTPAVWFKHDGGACPVAPDTFVQVDLDAGIDVPSVAPVGGVRFFGREAA